MIADIIEIVQFVGTAVWHVWPFFIVSIFLSVLIRVLKLDGTIRRAFDNRIGVAILAATLVGAFSPFCSCTVIPVIAGLLASGVPLAPIMSFWIASPTMDPEIFALSVGVLGWPMALARLGATLVLSLGAGYITLGLSRISFFQNVVLKPKTAVKKAPRPAPAFAMSVPQPVMAVAGTEAIPVTAVSTTAVASTACESGTCGLPQPKQATNWRDQIAASWHDIQWPAFGRDLLKESWSIGRWLLIAFVIEALITLYVPQASIAAVLGHSNQLAIPLAALVGVPLYLTNISALPIVSGLLAQGMQPGAAIAFLIAGPVTTIPAMTAVWGVVRRRVFVVYLSISLVGAILLGVLTNFLIP